MKSDQPFLPVEESFKIMADAAPVLIWMSGADKLYYFFNARWLKFTGHTIAQEQGNGWTESIHPEDLQYYLDTYFTVFDQQQEFKIEYRLRRYDGVYRWVVNSGVPRYLADGTFAGYIGSCIDIDDLLETERVKNNFIDAKALQIEQTLNEELSASNEELLTANEELLQAQDELAALNASLEEKVTARTNALAALNKELKAANKELITARDSAEKNEKLFRSIALNIPKSLIIVIDKVQRYLAIEGDLMVKMGYNGRDYTGKHPAEVMPVERYEASKQFYERLLAGEKFTIERKGDMGEDYKVDFVPLKNDRNEVYAGLIIALDITDIKQAEEKSAKLAAIVASSDDAIVSKTFDGIITSWNQAAERMFGYTEAEMIGQPILKIIPEDRQEEEPRIIARLRSGERVDHFETKRITSEKKLIDVSLTISPVRDAQGHIIGISKIARDISERKQNERRKDDFIGMVSHELKTPLTSLTAIIQVAEAKLKDNPDSFLTGAMAKAGRQIKKMVNLVNGFLDISRLESGKMLIEKQDFNLNALLKEIIAENELNPSTHIIQLGICDQMWVYADRDKIGSVIANFLSNAIKYSPRGKRIEVECQHAGKFVQVSVKDEGMGIKAQDLPRVFDRYYRVETNHTRNISGFGIGLYLCAEIIKHHGGKIWVESESGVGSTFYFSLPLAQQTNEQAPSKV